MLLDTRSVSYPYTELLVSKNGVCIPSRLGIYGQNPKQTVSESRCRSCTTTLAFSRDGTSTGAFSASLVWTRTQTSLQLSRPYSRVKVMGET